MTDNNITLSQNDTLIVLELLTKSRGIICPHVVEFTDQDVARICRYFENVSVGLNQYK